jgi:hypothetical protein
MSGTGFGCSTQKQATERGGSAPAFKRRSLFGLNAINFFQAEMVGVVLPTMGVFRQDQCANDYRLVASFPLLAFSSDLSPALKACLHTAAISDRR